MKALVTGAGGFLGSAIVEQLRAQGIAVRAYARGTYARLDALGVETVRGDVRDRAALAAACRGIDVVFHTAAVAGIGMHWPTYYETNTVGTLNVLEACRQNGVGRLVYTSSPSVTFDGSDQHGVDEDAPYPSRWLAHYPHSKALAEQAVLAANDPARLATCALRPHLIWGPGDRHLIPRLVARARSGRLRRVGDGTNLVDMIYIDNAAQAHLAAAKSLAATGSRTAGHAYFISQGEPVNCWGWINDILALAGLPPVDRRLSFGAAWAIGASMELAYRTLRLGGEPPMTRFLAAQLARSHYFNISRAERDFGYRATVATGEGMGRLAASLAAP